MSPSKLKKAFSDLMLEGVNITRRAQEGDAIYAVASPTHGKKGVDVVEYLNNVFTQYHEWKSKIRDFLTETNRNTLEWYQLYESDSVPHLKGGPDYGNIQSEKSQTLLRNIRVETSKTLALLKQVGDSIFKSRLPKIKFKNEDIFELKTKKNLFSFNVVTGDTVFNKVKTNFKAGQQKFKVLTTLISAKEHQADYETLCSSLKFENSKSRRSDIQQILKTIKEDLHILPISGGANPDIFINMERFGFRIVLP